MARLFVHASIGIVTAIAIGACGSSESSDSGATAPAASSKPSADAGAPDATTSVTPGDAASDATTASDAKPDVAQATCSGSKLTPGESTQTIDVGGVTRTFTVHVPPGYAGTKAVPLVFDFHPLTIGASTWKLATGWAAVSDKKNFILVWPQGHGESWNAGRCCDPAHAAQVDDVAFVRAMIAKLSSDACIDAKRVYATGCSNGGGLSYRLACDAADVIAAAAPVDFDCITGGTNSPSCGNCNPSRPISITQFRGTSDDSVPYEGGPTDVIDGLEFPGAKQNFSDWAQRNACAGSPTTMPNHPICETYGSCGAGTQTTLCSMPLGFHCTSYIPFGIADVAWGQFEKQSLP